MNFEIESVDPVRSPPIRLGLRRKGSCVFVTVLGDHGEHGPGDYIVGLTESGHFVRPKGVKIAHAFYLDGDGCIQEEAN